MASGVPIIASDLPTIREVLNEDNSIIINPDDPKQLAGAIHEVLFDRKKNIQRTTQAYSDVSKFAWENRVSRIMSFLG